MAEAAEDVYATLLTEMTYLPGALVLARSLRDAGTSKKLAVLYTPDTISSQVVEELKEEHCGLPVSLVLYHEGLSPGQPSGPGFQRIYEEITKVYDYGIPVERIRSDQWDRLQLMQRPDLHSSITKIHLWRLTQFRRVVYLDADVLALRAPDELFDLPHEFAAAPDCGWPDIFNSGVMALHPSVNEYHAMLDLARRGVSFDGADQGLLNVHFAGRFHRLPFTYNVTPSAHYQYLPAYRHFRASISLVHFAGPNKPWKLGSSTSYSSETSHGEMLARWWSVHNRHYKTEEPAEPPKMAWSAITDSSSAPSVPASQIHHDESSTSVQRPSDEGRPAGEQAVQVLRPMAAEASNQPSNDQGYVRVASPGRASSPPARIWNAQWEEPPKNSKPEAINWPEQVYDMSRDSCPFVPPERYPSPPANLDYVPPKAPSAPANVRPAPIFDFEKRQPPPTRSFAQPKLLPTVRKLSPEPLTSYSPQEPYQSYPPSPLRPGGSVSGHTTSWGPATVNEWDRYRDIRQYGQKVEQILQPRTTPGLPLRSSARKRSEHFDGGEDADGRSSLPPTPAVRRYLTALLGDTKNPPAPPTSEWITANPGNTGPPVGQKDNTNFTTPGYAPVGAPTSKRAVSFSTLPLGATDPRASELLMRPGTDVGFSNISSSSVQARSQTKDYGSNENTTCSCSLGPGSGPRTAVDISADAGLGMDTTKGSSTVAPGFRPQPEVMSPRPILSGTSAMVRSFLSRADQLDDKHGDSHRDTGKMPARAAPAPRSHPVVNPIRVAPAPFISPAVNPARVSPVHPAPPVLSPARASPVPFFHPVLNPARVAPVNPAPPALSPVHAAFHVSSARPAQPLHAVHSAHSISHVSRSQDPFSDRSFSLCRFDGGGSRGPQVHKLQQHQAQQQQCNRHQRHQHSKSAPLSLTAVSSAPATQSQPEISSDSHTRGYNVLGSSGYHGNGKDTSFRPGPGSGYDAVTRAGSLNELSGRPVASSAAAGTLMATPPPPSYRGPGLASWDEARDFAPNQPPRLPREQGGQYRPLLLGDDDDDEEVNFFMS